MDAAHVDWQLMKSIDSSTERVAVAGRVEGGIFPSVSTNRGSESIERIPQSVTSNARYDKKKRMEGVGRRGM